LCITARGLAAIGIDKVGASPEAPLLSERVEAQGDPAPETAPSKTTVLHKATAKAALLLLRSSEISSKVPPVAARTAAFPV
jgi:hypothetical protein